MIVSRQWLQRYFDAPLPPVEALADALTFHAFEIENIEGETFEVKVLPNRAADCLSHRGIARELAAILDIPAKPDLLRDIIPPYPSTDELTVTVDDYRTCLRHVGALVRGAKVGPSPARLKEALESVGQRSINNIVDATNFVMLDLGQPLHAFDAKKIAQGGPLAIRIRNAEEGEKVKTLSGEEYALTRDMLVIADAASGAALDIAGIKGGTSSAITQDTTDLFISVANFDGTLIRKTSQALKLWTDASKRFQNKMSPELPMYGLRAALELIKEVAGGELAGVVDLYPAPQESVQVPVSLGRINRVLGTEYSGTQIEGVFRRLGFAYKKTGEDFTVESPFERRDIGIPEDLVEEVGRIMGYDTVPATELPPIQGVPDQARYRGMERMKDQMVAEGFTEVSTQSFAKKGDIRLANPLDTKMPWLRTTLEDNLKDALAKAKLQAPLVLPPNAKPKLFEVGTVFPKEGEFIELRMTEPAWEGVPAYDNLTVAKLEDYGRDYEPVKHELGAYKPFSAYPFIVRDVAFWASADTAATALEAMFRDTVGELGVRIMQFDRFEKEGRVSYGYRIVFQSPDRTLTDDEVNAIMKKVSEALRAAGYEVR